MRKSLAAVAAVVSIFSLSGGAIAQSAASLSIAAPMSLASAEAGADTGQTSDLRGGFILPTLAIAAIIGIVILLTRNDSPSSP